MSEDTAKRQLYEAQIRYLQAADVDGLIDNQYTEDALLVSFDHQIRGNAALKEYFRGYLQVLGTIEVLSTDRFVETDDTVFFEATMRTNLGQARVFDARVLRGDKTAYHFTGVHP